MIAWCTNGPDLFCVNLTFLFALLISVDSIDSWHPRTWESVRPKGARSWEGRILPPHNGREGRPSVAADFGVRVRDGSWWVALTDWIRGRWPSAITAFLVNLYLKRVQCTTLLFLSSYWIYFRLITSWKFRYHMTDVTCVSSARLVFLARLLIS